MRRIAILVGFTSLLLLALSAPAAADEISGGCTATVNGRDVADITKSDPLDLEKGAMTVVVSGSVPPSALAAPASQVTTTLEIGLADAGFVPGFTETMTGHSYSGTALCKIPPDTLSRQGREGSVNSRLKSISVINTPATFRFNLWMIRPSGLNANAGKLDCRRQVLLPETQR
jgi:hypothetical protein